jgi:hypothetical protein
MPSISATINGANCHAKIPLPGTFKGTMTVTTAATSHPRPVSQAGLNARKEVTAMIKKIQEILFSGRKPASYNPRNFNGELLDGHREYVYVLMHQQIRGLN